MARTRFARARMLALANLTVIAVLAGCGGSTVEPTGAGADTATGSQSSAAGDLSVGTTAQVPGAGASGVAPGGQAAPGVVPGAATGGTATTGGGSAQDSTKAGKPAANAAKGGTGQAGASVLAADRMVASAPIFGGNGMCKPATLSEVNIGNVSTLSGVLGE